MQSNYSIAFMGTSLSWYWYYQPALIAMLQATTGRFIRPMGYGYNGVWSSTGVSIVGQVVSDRPDFAVVEYSMNDSAHVTHSDANTNTTTILTALKTVVAAKHIFLMTMNPSTDVERTDVNDYYDDYRALAVSQGVGLIDCYPAWLTYGAGTDHIPDGIHPTQPAAVAVTTPTIYAKLLPLIV